MMTNWNERLQKYLDTSIYDAEHLHSQSPVLSSVLNILHFGAI